MFLRSSSWKKSGIFAPNTRDICFSHNLVQEPSNIIWFCIHCGCNQVSQIDQIDLNADCQSGKSPYGTLVVGVAKRKTESNLAQNHPAQLFTLHCLLGDRRTVQRPAGLPLAAHNWCHQPNWILFLAPIRRIFQRQEISPIKFLPLGVPFLWRHSGGEGVRARATLSWHYSALLPAPRSARIQQCSPSAFQCAAHTCVVGDVAQSVKRWETRKKQPAPRE